MNRRYEDGLVAAFAAGAGFGGFDFDSSPPILREEYKAAYDRFRRGWGDLPTVRDYADARMTRTQAILTLLDRSGPGTADKPADIGGNVDGPIHEPSVITKFDHLHYNGICVKNRFGRLCHETA